MLTGFEKVFNTALRISNEDENKVADKVMDLRSRGYNPCELTDALKTFHEKLIADDERAIVAEAIEEIEGWCERDED